MNTPQTVNEFDWVAAQERRLNMYAFPGRQMALIGNSEQEVPTQGLTKREYFAAMAMQGLLANPELFRIASEQKPDVSLDIYSKAAIEHADDLLKYLDL